MKTLRPLILLAALAAGLPLVAGAQPAVPPPPPELATTNGPATPPSPTTPAPVAVAATNAPATNAVAPLAAGTNAPSAELSSTNTAAPATNEVPVVVSLNTNELRMNFRGVPLEMVLNYLSEAAGFVIVLETDVRGKVDVWSNTPVTKDEAVTLLNGVLNKNGYAAIRNDRTLTIVSRDSAKTRDIPVKRGSEPTDIPKNDEIVTQIIPVRYINAAQVTKDLQPLLPMTATMTANEAGNSLVITDTQASIRRMAEIVRALDTSLTNATSIRVYQLKFADAKTVATVIKDVFQSQDAGSRNPSDLRSQFFQRMRGGPFGGFGGPGGDQGGSSGGGGGGRTQQPKVIATSDDRSNSLVVSAPDEVIVTIDELVKSIDVDVEEMTVVRVFRLKHSDPVEMADLLAGLFPDESRSNDQNSSRRGFSFGGSSFFGGGRSQGTSSSQSSDRAKKMGRVLAVADQRTSSVVVSAARDLMEQIAAMIEQLDADPRRKQKVFVYSLENADVQEVEKILRNMFDKSGTMNNRSTQNQNSRLNTRSTQTQTTTGSGTTSSGSRSLGGGSLGGGGF